MLSGLPTTRREAANFTCDELQHLYMVLTSTKRGLGLRPLLREACFGFPNRPMTSMRCK